MSQNKGKPAPKEYAGVFGLVCGKPPDVEKNQCETIQISYSIQDTDKQDIQSNLEFQLRLQQYIELCRNRQLLEAMQYAQKFLASHVELWAVVQAAGLLAYPPETQTEPYKVCRFDIV